MSSKQGTFVGDLDQEMDNSGKQSSICDERSDNKVQEIKSEDISHVDKAKKFSPVRDEIVTEGIMSKIYDLSNRFYDRLWCMFIYIFCTRNYIKTMKNNNMIAHLSFHIFKQ